MWSYHNPVKLRFGAGLFAELPDAIAGRSYSLVTYPDAMFRDLAARLAAVAGAPMITIDDIAPNPDISLLAEQTARFSHLPSQPEVIVALGGGSVIDSAKVFAAARGDFAVVDAYLRKQAGPETIHPLPLIAVPTTAGTGSEVTCWGTVWDTASGSKFSLAHPGLYPELSLIDPALMIGKPKSLTIQTGLDTLSHSLESLWNHSANPVSMAHAVMAARGVIAALPKLANDLGNIDLRSDMARSASLAGFAFSNTKTAIAHSLSYPITLRHNVPHGIACSFSLPIVIRSVADAGGLCAEGIGAIFGSTGQAASEHLSGFLNGLGVSTDFHDYGITDAEFIELVDLAIDGERGQNFIGTKENLLNAAGLGDNYRKAVS
ncbi:MAG: phosphonoacetaldehyde reductase [Proteobacteria bacterium]|nr:phosphonoacetaldehyde reductase [Pseudomonadota bacterium]